MADEKAKPDGKQDEKTDDKKRKLLGIEPVETKHELAVSGHSLKYTARAGVIPLKDEFDDTEAEIFFTAYELDDVNDRSARPLTFVFNGGPGLGVHLAAHGCSRPQACCDGA